MPHCEKAKTYLVQLKKRRHQLKITVHDIGEDPQVLLRLKTLAAKFDMTRLGVSAFYVRGKLVVGFQSGEITGKHLEDLLGRALPGTGPVSEGTCPVEPEVPCPPRALSEDAGEQGIALPFLGDRSLPEPGLPLLKIFPGLFDGLDPGVRWVLFF